MIVVAGRLADAGVSSVARAIAARGGRVEVVGTAPPAAAGDRLLLELARAGVGHAAVLRSPAPDLEPADLDLALRYLPEGRVTIVIGASAVAPTAATAATWSGAALVVVTAAGDAPPDLAPGDRQLIIAAPARDPDGAFAGLLADLALRLDAGDRLEAAWSTTVESLAVEPVSPAAGSTGRAPWAFPAPPAPPRPRAARAAAQRASGRRSGRH